MKPARYVGFVLVFSWICTSPARSWKPETRVRMVDEAVRLMPASLRLALEHHRKALLGGALEPMTGEGGPAHLPPWQEGTLDSQVAVSALGLVASVENAAPFREVARGFGELAHYVADAGFPPGASGQAGLGRYEDFAAFCESRIERFPLVFYGHQELEPGDDAFNTFTLRILNRARAEDTELARAYAQAGDPPDPAAFDDRSVPFAVASLSYSHSVTDIVRAWLAAWKQAHGDTGRTPYTKPPERTAEIGDPEE